MVDAHHHLYDLENHHYPWLAADPLFETFLGDYRPICQTYGIDNYLADAGPIGLRKSVHIQSEFDPTNPVGETAWLQRIADKHGFPHGIVAWANLADSGVGELLEGHAGFPNTRGIRQNLNWDALRPERSFTDRGDYLTDSSWRAGFGLLQRYDMSFDLQILPHQLVQAADLAAAFPETQIILDHAGLPIDRDQVAMAMWRSGMRRLASFPNTTVKISGFGMLDHDWTVESIRTLVVEAIEIFGVNRAMFASNFPVDGLYATYSEVFSAYRTITAHFSYAERRALFSDNAERIYRL